MGGLEQSRVPHRRREVEMLRRKGLRASGVFLCLFIGVIGPVSIAFGRADRLWERVPDLQKHVGASGWRSGAISITRGILENASMCTLKNGPEGEGLFSLKGLREGGHAERRLRTRWSGCGNAIPRCRFM
jgi:hypothetical protein